MGSSMPRAAWVRIRPASVVESAMTVAACLRADGADAVLLPLRDEGSRNAATRRCEIIWTARYIRRYGAATARAATRPYEEEKEIL